jgi:transcriptional regulator with XRE-family HTH domain
MPANNGNSAATHFGRVMKRDRLAHGWTLRELAERTEIDFTTLSRIENGKRPPNEKAAQACDAVFPDRRGWYCEWYEEFTTWTEIPANFRDWSELEARATSLSVWTPGIVDGLLQTEDYARALISTSPKITSDVVAARVASRMERQRRVLDSGVRASFVVDEVALYRHVGSSGVMAGQLRRVAEVSAMPNVTMQVLPAVAHPANASAFIVTDSAAWCEHVNGGFTYVTEETVNRLSILFGTLRGESYRVSESLALTERMAETWATGGSQLTLTLAADSASKSRRPTS